MPARGAAVSVRRKRKPSEFHSEVTRERIRATLLVERLQAHFFGKLELTMSQIRTAEILLRKVLPDLSKTDINDTSPHRYVIEVPPDLTLQEWQEKYGPKDQTIQ
jgi:hypothetical protein